MELFSLYPVALKTVYIARPKCNFYGLEDSQGVERMYQEQGGNGDDDNDVTDIASSTVVVFIAFSSLSKL